MLRPDDQLVVAIALAVFLLLMGTYFWHRHQVGHGLIEFDDLPGRRAEYLVDINTASWPEFTNLPGIGEKLAKQIVHYRNEIGGFERTEQLLEISGIGEHKFMAMQAEIQVVDSSHLARHESNPETPAARYADDGQSVAGGSSATILESNRR